MLARTSYRDRLFGLAFFTIAMVAMPARCEILEVSVGVTPTCPYGLSGCWAGCAEALNHINGVRAVAAAPDTYNCTATVFLEKHRMPDIIHWHRDFEKTANKAYGFRGVELTVRGRAQLVDGRLILNSKDSSQPIELLPLEHKLQWNFHKGRARQPEPEEAEAQSQLLVACSANKGQPVEILVTGPLRSEKDSLVLEVREYFLVTR